MKRIPFLIILVSGIIIYGCNPTTDQTDSVIDSNYPNGLTSLDKVSSIELVSPSSSPGIIATPTIRLHGLNSQDTLLVYSDSSCSNLIMQENSTGTTHEMTLPTLSVGSHTFYVKRRWSSYNIESGCSTASLQYTFAFFVVSAPTISGFVISGQTLSVTDNGTWSATPTSFNYQWKNDGTNISGETSSTLTVVPSMEGSDITCDITASYESVTGTVESGNLSNFYPGELALLAWYDANDSASIIEGGGPGTGVTQWNDRSANAYHLTGTNTALDPLYDVSESYVEFLDDRHFANTGLFLNDTYSVVVVGTPAISGGWATLLRGESAHHPFILSGGGLIGTYANNQGEFMGSSIVWTKGTFGLAILRHDGVSDTFDVDMNGGALSESNVPGITDITNSNYINVSYHLGQRWGKLNDLILLNSFLSEPDREKIEGYLAHKWGFTSSLPLDHPYKSTPP